MYNSMWNNVINAWWPLLFYPATDAPRFQKGMVAMICTCVATLGVTALVWYLERREKKRKPRLLASGIRNVNGRRNGGFDFDNNRELGETEGGEKQTQVRTRDSGESEFKYQPQQEEK